MICREYIVLWGSNISCSVAYVAYKQEKMATLISTV